MAAAAPKIVAGEKVALALGAGGARGLAQVGVIEALCARGLNIVAVSGASSGALVGGIYAAGKLTEFREQMERLKRRHFLRLLDPVMGQGGLMRGDALVAAMQDVVGNPDIESLPIDFTAVAVDLERQREVWLRSGPLWDALRASFAIPGVFTPFMLHGRALVDGGLLAPLPIAATRMSDAHRLIAVDMHDWPRQPPGQPADPEQPSGSGSMTARLGDWFDRRTGGDADESDNGADSARNGDRKSKRNRNSQFSIVETMSRSLDTMQAQISRMHLALDPPELVVRIPRDACQFYEFWRAAELIEIGREEADKVLDAAGY